MKNMVIIKTFFIFTIFLSLLSPALGQEPPIKKTYESSRVYLNSALHRLEAKEVETIQAYDERQKIKAKGKKYLISPLEEETSPLLNSSIVRSKIAQWERDPSEKNLITALDSVTALAISYSVNSNVTIVTMPKNGATIKYQTVGERDRNQPPFTAKCLTKCVETMPIGYYYIWSERHGKITSIMDNEYKIIKPDEIVEINEIRKQ